MRLIDLRFLILILILINISNCISSEEDELEKKSNEIRFEDSFLNDNAENNRTSFSTLHQQDIYDEEIARLKDSYKKREDLVKYTIKASNSELCDWTKNPLSLIKGELCGSYYKVLGFHDPSYHRGAKSSSKIPFIEKSHLKKAFRTLSLAIHPDKHISKKEAEIAFAILQHSYSCLVDTVCRQEYDYKLDLMELEIAKNRQILVDKFVSKSKAIGQQTFFLISLFAQKILDFSNLVWSWADEVGSRIKLPIPASFSSWMEPITNNLLIGNETSIGRISLLLLLFWKGKPILLFQSLALLIYNFNKEMVKLYNYNPFFPPNYQLSYKNNYSIFDF